MMEPVTTVASLLKVGQWAIERIWPDPQKQAEEQRKLAELAQKGSLAELDAHVQLMLGQLEINKTEAAHPSRFIAGWRPGIGWVCAITLAFAYIPKVVVLTVMWTWSCYLTLDVWVPTETDVIPMLPAFPDLGITDLIGLLMSMLGIGAMRSYDKLNGAQTDRVK